MLLVNILVVLIALLHVWILILEMFLWQTPMGMKTFRLSQEFAHQSAALAANQGLYNGFLSAGLLWSVFYSNPSCALHIKIFFLSCVSLAGIYGSISIANRRIFFIQALPALIALILLFLVNITLVI